MCVYNADISVFSSNHFDPRNPFTKHLPNCPAYVYRKLPWLSSREGFRNSPGVGEIAISPYDMQQLPGVVQGVTSLASDNFCNGKVEVCRLPDADACGPALSAVNTSVHLLNRMGYKTFGAHRDLLAGSEWKCLSMYCMLKATSLSRLLVACHTCMPRLNS